MRLSLLKKSGSWNGWQIIWLLLLLPADKPLACRLRNTGGWKVNEPNPVLPPSISRGAARLAAAAAAACCCCGLAALLPLGEARAAAAAAPC
jgi:hypothetical protein